jgi:phospholipase C
MVAGQDGTQTNPQPRFDLTYGQIGTELTNAHVDWKYYSGAWNDKDNCQPYTKKTQFGLNHTDFSFYWGVLIDFPAIQQNPASCHNMLNLSDLMQNVSSGYLPQVTWVMPDRPHSEHPKSTGSKGLINGQKYTATLIDAISSNPLLWDNTAIFLAWDDWGGYYDHVAPNQVDQFGYGFRVPLIVISPYTKSGIYYGLSNQKQEDFTALLATIEQNWNLPHLTARDASQYSLFYMLDFSQPPLRPLILPTSTLSVYPFQTCISRGICSTGTNALLKFSFQQIPGEYLPQGDTDDPND